jgi:hypothetical protein
MATAWVVANPLEIFLDTCLNFTAENSITLPPLLKKHVTEINNLKQETLEHQLIRFESDLLKLHNLKDRNKYYLSVINEPSLKQQFLMCQIHLSDEIFWIMEQLSLEKINQEKANLTGDYLQLLQQIQTYKTQLQDVATKSNSAVLSSIINKNLQKPFNIITNQTCDIDNNVDEQSNNDNTNIENTNIAKYLIEQQNEQCRKLAWINYQKRAKQLNADSLFKLHFIKQQYASSLGYTNFSQFQLDNLGFTQYQFEQFLNSKTKNLNIAPWNLARKLKSLAKSPDLKLNSETLFTNILNQLALLGVTIEAISYDKNQQYFKLWHEGRLLGDLILNIDASNKSSIATSITTTVVGHQFGQVIITVPEIIQTPIQVEQFISVLSNKLVELTNGNKFYYLKQTDKGIDLGAMWLSHWIKLKLNLQLNSQRLELIKAFKEQQNVFRAKLILDFYNTMNFNNESLNQHKLRHSMSQAFKDSFNITLPDPVDQIFSFNTIANQGLSYYLWLWNDTLSQIILMEDQNLIKSRLIFNTLVINENNLSLYQQLSIIFDQPMDFDQVMRRIHNVNNNQK